MTNSYKRVTNQRHYHECPKCGEKDLCRTDSVHHCRKCGNTWYGAVKRPLPRFERKGRPRNQPAPRPEELLAAAKEAIKE